jgi:hypothetical protein
MSFPRRCREDTAERRCQVADRKIFVLLQVYDGLNDGIGLFWDEKESEAAFKEYTGHDYPENNSEEAWEDIPEKLSDTQIYEVVLPEEPEKGGKGYVQPQDKRGVNSDYIPNE